MALPTGTGIHLSPEIWQTCIKRMRMYLEQKIPLGTLLGWWSSLWENWVVRPAYVVLPVRLQSPSAPPVLLPAPPPGSLSSVWWLAPSICICIGQLLAEPSKEQPHRVPDSKRLLAKVTVSGFAVCKPDGSQVGASPVRQLWVTGPRVLGTELESSTRPVNPIHDWAISPALHCISPLLQYMLVVV